MTYAGKNDAFTEHAAWHCPRCDGVVHRISRRSMDRLLSLFSPVWRYRCRDRRCEWEGRVRVSRMGERQRRCDVLAPFPQRNVELPELRKTWR